MRKPEITPQPLCPATSMRLTPTARKRIRAACAHLHWSEADTLRLIIDTGLEHLERIQYNLPAAVINEARRRPPPAH